MTKVVTAKYDASHNALRLVEPLEGVKDHETVKVTVTVENPVTPEQPPTKFSGVLSQEAGESLARAYEEMFGDSSDEN